MLKKRNILAPICADGDSIAPGGATRARNHSSAAIEAITHRHWHPLGIGRSDTVKQLPAGGLIDQQRLAGLR